MARASREESDEMNNAMGQKTLLPRGASTVYFSMDDDDGDLLAAQPTPLVEVLPQLGVLRHTAAHIVDILPYVQILDVPVPKLGNQVVEFMQKIDTQSLVEQVTAVPRISLDRNPTAFCGSPSAEDGTVGGSAHYRVLLSSSRLPSRSSTFQFQVVEVVVDGERS